LLNTNGKTRDHGHARADIKKMGIRQALWLDDLVKETELPTSCITLSKHGKKKFCGFLKNVKVSSDYSTNVLSHPILRLNRLLIVCVCRNQVYTHTIWKMDIE
jgi:hypothetical protein